jgi:transposase-like protein
MSASLLPRWEGASASLLFSWRRLDREGSLVAVSAGEVVVAASKLPARADIAKLQRVWGLGERDPQRRCRARRRKKWIARSPLLPVNDQ